MVVEIRMEMTFLKGRGFKLKVNARFAIIVLSFITAIIAATTGMTLQFPMGTEIVSALPKLNN